MDSTRIAEKLTLVSDPRPRCREPGQTGTSSPPFGDGSTPCRRARRFGADQRGVRFCRSFGSRRRCGALIFRRTGHFTHPIDTINTIFDWRYLRAIVAWSFGLLIETERVLHPRAVLLAEGCFRSHRFRCDV